MGAVKPAGIERDWIHSELRIKRLRIGDGAPGLMPRPATIAELEDWTLNGASWEPVELSNRRAVIELCTCHGERVDVVESEDPEFIEYVRVHRED
jgi:hypothetical protein